MIKTTESLELLRKKDLHPDVGVPKSTVADWIEDFNVYIPKVKQGSVTYYRPETIDVLKFIKQCRDQNYQKPQIMELLAKKGFTITVAEAVEDVKRVIDGGNARDTLLTVMQTMGQAVTKIAEQDEDIKLLKKSKDEQDGKLVSLQYQQTGQNERMIELEKRTDEIEYLKQELDSLRKELAATKEKKGFFSRLFGK